VVAGGEAVSSRLQCVLSLAEVSTSIEGDHSRASLIHRALIQRERVLSGIDRISDRLLIFLRIQQRDRGRHVHGVGRIDIAVQSIDAVETKPRAKMPAMVDKVMMVVGRGSPRETAVRAVVSERAISAVSAAPVSSAPVSSAPVPATATRFCETRHREPSAHRQRDAETDRPESSKSVFRKHVTPPCVSWFYKVPLEGVFRAFVNRTHVEGDSSV
jgi:hypothetical protein